MNLRYKPGMRSVKTALAVLVCLLVSYLVLRRDSAFYSCIAAIVCMQPTYEQSFTLGINRLIGTAIGGFVGYLSLVCFGRIPPHLGWLSALLLPVFLVLAIYLCNVTGREKSTSICCIVLLSIALNHGGSVSDAVWFALNRVVDTAIGIVIAIGINRWIDPRSQSGGETPGPEPGKE